MYEFEIPQTGKALKSLARLLIYILHSITTANVSMKTMKYCEMTVPLQREYMYN